MAEVKMDSIVLGHNAFFGIDHLSASRGQVTEAKFADVNRILEFVADCMKEDVSALMMSTHPRAHQVAAVIRKEKRIYDDIRLYPLLPYMQKYVVAANQKGMIPAVLSALSEASLGEKIGFFLRGTIGALEKDMRAMLFNLIQMELLPFKGFHMPCVFLHDALTDIALALDLKGIFEFYTEVIAKDFASQAAFATKNLPRLTEQFRAWGFPAPITMTHVNKVGFSVNPSRAAVEETLRTRECHVMAMSTLASGYLKPKEAYEYIGKLSGIDSIVVGSSNRDHILETIRCIRENVWLNRVTVATEPVRLAS